MHQLPIRERIARLPSSEIRDVSEIGMAAPNLIPLWFGESDEPTPDFIKQAAIAALDRNETFYASNNGVPEVRDEVAAYMRRLYGIDMAADRITVTASGMQAIILVMQALINPRDNVIVVGPVWPNLRETVHIMGGTARDHYLVMRDGRWQLDLERLFARVTARTKAIFINSPGNPTGWVMSAEEQREMLAFCARRGIWIIADDVYARIIYDRPLAPSFIELAGPEDLVIAINSFSKSWSMTGWRLGWITAPAALLDDLAKLMEFNIAAATTFVQHAGAAALRDGDEYVDGLVERLRRRRDLVCQRLAGHGRVKIAVPQAALYAFFAVDGITDSFQFCVDLVRNTGVGLAPGSAFGPAGQGYLRLCFASSDDSLREALDRMEPYLNGHT